MPLIKNASAEAGTQNKNQKDLRPRFGIGHMVMHAADVEALTAFYGRVGMRVVVQSSNFAILELRGGTLTISFDEAGAWMDGPAEIVFSGSV